ncbi:LOG family protein [Candidatus Peregrinibacteria bacterium]|nr:LOG family protein [Candidatus Peregrinibacteria bacterium]
MKRKIQKNTWQTLAQELKKNHFRVAIFGSARIKKNDLCYEQVFELASEIGKHHFDIVTGGGPGLMEAANAGHEHGRGKNGAHSIGLTIDLPKENFPNKHLDVREHFAVFSKRLDTFMMLSGAVVIMPGGVGTSLEFFYSWQLSQVKHIPSLPIILYGEMWEHFMQWVADFPLKDGYISPEDLENIHQVRNEEEAMEIILKAYKACKEK